MNCAGRWLIASLGAVVGLLGGGALLHAGSDPAALLQASESADQRISYSGTKVVRVYRPGETTPVMERVVKVWHQSPDLTRMEFVSPADSVGKVAIENGEGLWLFHPRRQSWRAMPWRSPRPRLSLLLRNYQVQIMRRERVAGRPVVTLHITSRYSGNPSKIVWIDARTKIPLRQELYDAAGKRVGATEFREISYEASLPANLFTVPAEARRGPADRRAPGGLPEDGPRTMIGNSATEPHYVPAGYMLVRKLAFRRPGLEFTHLRYTDGLNTISLFQERRSGQPDGPGPDGRGTASAPSPSERDGPRRHHHGPDARMEAGDWQQMNCGQRLTWTWGDTRYTLVGSISAAELRRMADSIPHPPQIASGQRKK
jgi:outer membrane lipoprotein-sorting protein